MHPLFMDRLVSDRHCDLLEEAGAACRSAPRKVSVKGRKRWSLRRRRPEPRDP
ncbi:MAG TPA: hypothetical protein VHI71_11755 [Actinomycetota bacterium]|nr:hypothetical protein [Actinomycetota bacterium]